MNENYKRYNDTVSSAFSELVRKDELVVKKTQNITSLLADNAKTVLHFGFGPVAVGLAAAGYTVHIADATDTQGFASFNPDQRYDAVIALDEYFTFAASEDEQNKLIDTAFDLTKKMLITSLSDYKNMSENHREFSDPQSYKTINGTVAYLERHIKKSRNSWQTKIHKILETDECITTGPFERRSLYFKQLARHAEDFGSKQFEFQKSMMYKGMLRKSYEHIIMIRF